MKSKRNTKYKRNRTLKKKVDISKLKLSDSETQIICSKFSKPLKPFEYDIPKLFKNKHMITSKKYNLEKEILKNFKQAVSPSKITPQNDFYSYVNDRWLKDFKVAEHQKYIIQVDDFRLVQDKVYRQLVDIIKEYISTHNTDFSNCLKNFYKSALLHQISLKQLQETSKIRLEEIDDIIKNSNLWELLGFLNLNEIISWGSPLVWSVNLDDAKPDIFRCYIEGPQLSLADITVYSDESKDLEYTKNYKKQYFKYLDAVFEYSFGKNNPFKPEHIFNCEIKIFNAYDCRNIKKEDPNGYNVVKTAEALHKYKFDWKNLAKALGFSYTPDFFITSNLNYLFCITDILLKEWQNEEWRSYFIYLFIRQQQRYCLESYKNFYDFQGKFSRGQEDVVNVEICPIYPFGYAFNTFLTREYERKYRNDQLINYTKVMAEDLKTVFVRIIKRNKWLQPSTRKMAIKKLENFKFTFSSPTDLREDPILDYSPTDIWYNLWEISVWKHKQAIQSEGKKIFNNPLMDWSAIPPKFIGTQSYVVNASYTPSENGIYVPLGYIQKPFVDLDERGIEYNLAHIGFTLAHEMSHALDDWGSKYDEKGVLNNWWTEKDRKMFEKIQKNVIKQYEVFASYDGIKFDAEPSIGEDLADITGLAICREYLRDFQLKNEDILPIKKLSFETFFVYFAFQQRQKLNKKALENQIKTNPHPPDKYRCNVPLSRLPIFRTIFNVKKGDKMWWNSTNRVWDN